MTKSFLHKHTIVYYAAWWLVWIFVQAIMLQQFGIANKIAFIDAVISMLLLAAFCLLIINNMRFYLPKKEKYWYVFAVGFVLGGLWLILVRIFLTTLFKNDIAYFNLLQNSSAIRFAFGFLMIVCISAISLLWYTQQNNLQTESQQKEIEKLAKDAELYKLRQQLQPHFLFNSLNSISALTGSNTEKARHMIQQLSDFLRGTLKKEEHHWNTIQEEWQYLELYLDIEKVRFGHRLQTLVNIDDAVMDLKIPALLLQPVVENAIKFGLYDTIGEVTIGIEISKKNNQVYVVVTNPYDAATAQPLQGTGFGLPSVKRRLFLLFGRNDLFKTEQANEKFSAIITIPITV